MFKKLNFAEPAVLRGIVAALIGLATSLGFTVNTNLSGEADTLIVAFTTVLPILQAVWTRISVWSPKNHANAVHAAVKKATAAAGPLPPVTGRHEA